MNNRFILMSGFTVCLLVSGVMGTMPLRETQAQSLTPAQQGVLLKGQLFYDRWCALADALTKDHIKAIGKHVNDMTADLNAGTIANPETTRRNEERTRRLDLARRNVQDAARDLDLFEIDIKAKYGGALPIWWQYTGVEKCPKRDYRP